VGQVVAVEDIKRLLLHLVQAVQVRLAKDLLEEMLFLILQPLLMEAEEEVQEHLEGTEYLVALDLVV
jgi:hypothetical protein